MIKKIRKKLSLYIKEYKNLSILTIISILIVLLYTFTSEIPELFKYGEETFFMAYSISIAIISNCIFSYFQIFIPKYNKRDLFIKRIINSLEQIRNYLKNGPEEIYHLKYKDDNIGIEDIPDDKLKVLIKDFNLLSETKNRYSADTLQKMTIFDAMNSYKFNINIMINSILSRYGDFIDINLISLLFRIQDCTYFSSLNHIDYLVHSVIPIIQPDKFDGNVFNFVQIKNLCKELSECIKSLKGSSA